jgi:RimJ/RimL family protein N-acetyltransferase
MIRGEKVRLRALDEDDLELWWRWCNDWEVGRWMINRYPSPKSDERDDIREMMKSEPDHKVFAIETHEGDLIGGCDLTHISWEDRRAQLGLAIGEKGYWGKGYGTDATWTLVRFGFEEMNLNRVQLFVYADNVRAIRCYEKLGFVHEGVLRCNVYRDGEYIDAVAMSMLREEYLALLDRSGKG